MLLSGAVCGSYSVMAAQQIDNGTYIIKNKFSAKVLDVLGGSSADGASVVQNSSSGASTQQWNVNYLGDNQYSLISAGSGKALEVYNWSTEDGADIAQWTYWAGDPQRWILSDQGNGYFSVTNGFSGKSAEVFDWSTADGGNIAQWSFWGGDSQLWAFQSLDTGAAYHWPTSGDVGTHDPTMMEENGTYYEFQTGAGIYRKVSYDGQAWLPLGSVLPNGLSWWSNYVPGQVGIDVWAPDVKAYNGRVYLYYSISTFGSRQSAIGLLSASSLAADDWRDDGMVTYTTSSSSYNAIDPDLVLDKDGSPWMVFGSWSSGIKLTRLNGSTMKPTGSLYSLASRSGGIEAPSITYRNGYYYLFVSTGVCCAGVNSTYQIQYGRSTQITGPYLDKNGVDMMSSGGSLLDGGNAVWVGPGGQDIVGNHTVVRHAYDATDNGAAKLLISKLNWDANGWPRY
ncbi:MAG: family 43 glycosylhydrolase [Spongiibacteraceae bacterium]|nr:family 43 glycosylhydrolase [Spongiibacteraceae bacterium]